MCELGLIEANDERFLKTCETIGRELTRNGFMMRYTAEDDFGMPETSFLVCQFWYIDALTLTGRRDEARGSRRAAARAARPGTSGRQSAASQPSSRASTP